MSKDTADSKDSFHSRNNVSQNTVCRGWPLGLTELKG